MAMSQIVYANPFYPCLLAATVHFPVEVAFAARLHEMLWAWREQATKLEAGEISQEEYDRWRYHYPEYDGSQIRIKVPPEGLI